MKIIQSIQHMKDYVTECRQRGKSIGFVPTMGFLHEGHLSLIEAARRENDIVVLSIFVNPLQFGPNEDFDRYPRDIERDELLAKEKKVDVLFYPGVEEMYPTPPSAVVTVKKRVNVLCGKSREGHFDGVATVLVKLFHIIQPTKVYFGMKDAQQVAVVDGLIQDFNFPIEMIPVPTVREDDGLAKSSRNVYLTEDERKEAPHLYRSLLLGKEMVVSEKNISYVKEKMVEYIQEHTSGEVDYYEILSFPELKELDRVEGSIIIALAVKFSKARLIDNITFSI
ncbi:pantoate--beta-alanine ligase [Fictibacillus sp. Mic-4]|uniref:pantoate--beta-alanine ligase n=1 Tax=Fictibacillus TaxID=1329200 RepID=UPI0004177717|nr:pantoate--beta-alanine ligase [Fictibacillus gelatini]